MGRAVTGWEVTGRFVDRLVGLRLSTVDWSPDLLIAQHKYVNWTHIYSWEIQSLSWLLARWQAWSQCTMTTSLEGRES